MGLFRRGQLFLSDGEIYMKIRDVISAAKKRLVIVSPYIAPTDDFVREIITASEVRKVDVSVVFRSDLVKDPKEKVRTDEWLGKLDDAGVFLGVIERLHSKLYLNERHLILTSMNFHRSSGEHSYEAGVQFECRHKIAVKATEYVDKLIARWTEPATERSASIRARRLAPPSVEGSAENGGGHCIRCRRRITFDGDKPYCRDDFKDWANSGYGEQPEDYCHACGSPWRTTRRRPLCQACFLASKRAQAFRM